MDFTTRLLFHKNEEPKDNLVFSIVNSNVEDELGKIKNELAQTQTLPATPVDEANAVNRPYCLTEKGIGYLKFGKYGRKKKIGSKDSRPYLFLDCILVQIEAFKTIEAVFSAIWQEKDGKDQRLTDPATSGSRKVEIIKNSAIKELQKGNKLGGKMKFEFNESETRVRAVLVD